MTFDINCCNLWDRHLMFSKLAVYILLNHYFVISLYLIVRVAKKKWY